MAVAAKSAAAARPRRREAPFGARSDGALARLNSFHPTHCFLARSSPHRLVLIRTQSPGPQFQSPAACARRPLCTGECKASVGACVIWAMKALTRGRVTASNKQGQGRARHEKCCNDMFGFSSAHCQRSRKSKLRVERGAHAAARPGRPHCSVAGWVGSGQPPATASGSGKCGAAAREHTPWGAAKLLRVRRS